MWSDLDDEIIGGDLTAALAYLTPAGGAVLTPVAPVGLRDREAATVSFTTSLGFGRKLERIDADPHVALAFHAREHGFARPSRFVLVQGVASYDAHPDREYLEQHVGPASARFLGEPQRGVFWDRWLSAYYADRVIVTVQVERVVSWPDLACAGDATVAGSPLAHEDPEPQAPPKRGTGPRVDSQRAARRAGRLPHVLLAYRGADGLPLVAPVTVGAPSRLGFALSGPLPARGRRAGLLAHRYEPRLIGLETRQHTGWLQDGVYAPHSEGGFRAPANKTLVLLANGLLARRGLAQARAKGRAALARARRKMDNGDRQRGEYSLSSAAPARERGSSRQRPQVAIVGAGVGGIAAAIELRRHGISDVTILERAPDLGGTWHYNSYPGAACDIPSHLYSFSYAQRRDWSRLCSPQAEIESYLQQVARAHGVSPLIVPNTTVVSCSWDERDSRWTLTTESGERYAADALIIATGQLHQPSVPQIDGIETFAGHSFHSARWDHDYPLAGKRVAVVGTGASAVQFVPEIAAQVKRLTVFQRTGNWMLPRRNRPYPRYVRAAIAHVPGLQALRRKFVFQYAESLTRAIRNPQTIGRLLHARSIAFMRLQLRDPRDPPQGLAELHLRLQARAVQLDLPADAAARQRRPRHRRDHERHARRRRDR